MNISEFKDTIWDYTRKINENTSKVMCPLCDRFGLTVMQLGILMELHKGEAHSIGSLAESICAAGTNISSMCKRLEGMGLLKRVREAADERVVKVVLTDKGKEIITDIDYFFCESISRNIDTQTEECMEEIILGMRKLNELLQKIISTDS